MKLKPILCSKWPFMKAIRYAYMQRLSTVENLQFAIDFVVHVL